LFERATLNRPELPQRACQIPGLDDESWAWPSPTALQVEQAWDPEPANIASTSTTPPNGRW